MRKISLHFILILACFILSGIAGLIYQTAWIRQFALVFGASELAIVAVLAAYMGGLALGAGLMGRWQASVRRPILVYGFLELGIALSALAVPIALGWAHHLQMALFSGPTLMSAGVLPSSTIYYLVVTFVILLLPTGFMGATLPLLVRHGVRHDSQIGSRTGMLYSANTLGAAAGALLTAFVLLPRFGLNHTIQTAWAINFIVFIIAVILARTESAPEPAPVDVSSNKQPSVSLPSTSGDRWILPVILVSGMVSFTYEVLWTRLLTSLLGGSIYAFGVMLATFLMGLSFGSAVVSPFARTPLRAKRLFVWAQVGIAICSIAALGAANPLLDLMQQQADIRGISLAYRAGFGALLILPGAVCIGSTFPLAVRIRAHEANHAALASAQVFSWNTLGAIIGAIAAGLWILPTLRFAGTVTLAATTSMILAAVAAFTTRPRYKPFIALALITIILAALIPPSTPWSILRYSPLSPKPMKGELRYYGIGRSSNVLVLESRIGEYRLSTNGLPEASIQRPGSRPGSYVVAKCLSLLGLAARPDIRDMMVVGFGAGAVVEDVPASVKNIHVVELEPEVIKANRSLADKRRKDPLSDPRVRVYLNDARSALTLTRQRFGLIVSQPSHPWTAGGSHLYTREFFRLVSDRLQPDGIFVQWMGLQFVDEDLLRSLIATLVDVFPHLEVYLPASQGSLLFLASKEPLDMVSTTKQTLRLASQEWRALGITVWEDIIADRVLTSAGSRRFAGDASLISDGHNLLQTRSPRILEKALRHARADRLFASLDPFLNTTEVFDRLYMVRRFIYQRQFNRAQRVAKGITDPVLQRTASGLVLLAKGEAQRARQFFWQARQFDPAAVEPIQGLLRLNLSAIRTGKMPPDLYGMLGGHPQEATLVTGWEYSYDENWTRLRSLDSRLAGIGVYHPFYREACRLRAEWRVASGDAALAVEAQSILTPLLAARARTQDLVLEAEARLHNADFSAVLLRWNEIIGRLGRRPSGQKKILEKGKRMLDRIPRETRSDPQYLRLNKWFAEKT